HIEKGEYADGLEIDYHMNILSIDTNTKLYSITNNVYQTMNLALNNLTNAPEDLHIHFDDPMLVEEFLSISAKNIVYEIPANDQVIEEL
ncbi:19320_t:CDS:2, partial [Dentiscutata erythropus]